MALAFFCVFLLKKDHFLTHKWDKDKRLKEGEVHKNLLGITKEKLKEKVNKKYCVHKYEKLP